MDEGGSPKIINSWLGGRAPAVVVDGHRQVGLLVLGRALFLGVLRFSVPEIVSNMLYL